MKGTTIVNDFKDLKKAIEEITNNQPADTQYEVQAKKMGYTQDKSIGVAELREDEMSRAKEVIALQKKHDNEKETEKDKLEKEKEQAKSSAERAKQTESVELDEALSPKDKKVIDAFYDGKEMDGKTVKSVGDKLETTGMGAQVVLKRQGNKFRIFGVIDSRRVQEIIRYIKKSYPKNTIIESESVVTEANLMPSIQKIVDTKGAAKVGGVMLDMFTASVLTQAYAKVSDANKKKMETSNITTLVKLAQKVMGLKASNEFGKDPLKGFPYNEVKESIMNEITMGDMLIDIQQGATAKEISKTYKMPLSTAKDFLKSYYGQKKGSRKEEVIDHDCATHVEHSKFGSGLCVSGQHDLIEQEDGSFKVEHYTVEFSHGIEEMVSIYELNVTKESSHKHQMSKTAGRKKLKAMHSPKDVNEATAEPLAKMFKTTDKKALKGIMQMMNMTSVKVLQDMQKQNPKGFLKTVMSLGEEVETVYEGTWAIPSTIDKMKKFQGLLQKPMFAKNKASVEKFKDSLYSLIGDDELFDVYDGMIMDKEFNGENMVELLVKSLEGRWFNFKKKGRGWVATHQYFPMEPEDDVDEGKGRPTGYYKPKKKQLVTENKESFVTKSPFKLKSKQYPRALAIETKGYGKRHASESDLIEACDSFGMITEEELQIQQLEKTLGKKGFLTYDKTELNDIFEDRETQRMILALESITEDTKPTEYDRETITRALDEDLNVEFTKPDGMKAQGPVLKMNGNTYNLKDMHTGKSFTFKYIDEDQNMKSFSQIISEARFSTKLVKQAGGIAFDKRYVGGNMTGAIKAIEALKKGLSDDPKVKEILKYANESFNNQFYKAMSEEEKTDYQKFFMSALKKFGVNSPSELDDGKKKEFFNYVDKNYKAKDEQQFDEKAGKYSMYSDLLLQKQRFVAKGELKTPVLDKAIEKEKKKLGIKDSVNKVDGRVRPFKEKMTKLGYFKR